MEVGRERDCGGREGKSEERWEKKAIGELDHVWPPYVNEDLISQIFHGSGQGKALWWEGGKKRREMREKKGVGELDPVWPPYVDEDFFLWN